MYIYTYTYSYIHLEACVRALHYISVFIIIIIKFHQVSIV